jgi:hypothetical protein
VTAGGEPGRDDSGLPPVHIQIPDDARELERDVLAYRREVRARRRRQRLRRLLDPITGPGTALPLIFTCVALSLIAGAMLSFLTISPASAPTRQATRPSAGARPPGPHAAPGTTRLPPGTVQLMGRPRQLSTLVSDVLVLIPAGCDCGTLLTQIVSQADSASVPVYFVGSDAAAPEVAALASHYGDGKATAVYDKENLLRTAFAPSGVTVLLVHKDAGTEVRRDLRPGAQLGDLHRLLGTP